MHWGWRCLVTFLALLLFSCSNDPPPFDESWAASLTRVYTDSFHPDPGDASATLQRAHVRDQYGRYVHFHGINLSGSNKFPPTESFPDLGDKVSYVGKPFPSSEADEHFTQLQRLGFNSVRFLVNWEALQPDGPDKFDEDYLDYVDEMVARAAAYGIYVLIDMHQDLFSRHLTVYFNKHPKDADGNEYPMGSLESQLFSLVPPYDNWVRGDGAPRWVVQTCLPEKQMDSPAWGIPRPLYNLGPDAMIGVYGLFDALMPAGEDGPTEPPWLNPFLAAVKKQVDALPKAFQPYTVRQSNDFLPFTFWGVNGALSVDLQRCFACFFAGDKVTPGYEVNGMSVKDFLQDQYAKAFVKLAERVKKHRNVIGYDIINEPIGAYVTYAAVALYFQTGLDETVATLLNDLLGPELGANLHKLLTGLQILPPDTKPETKEAWGFDGVDAMAVLDLNYGFDAKYLQPLYERVGTAILAEDPNAVIWFEPAMGLSTLLGDSAQWQINMTRPQSNCPADEPGCKREPLPAVFAPHWYPDIYPFIGLNQPPRQFGPDEWKYRSFDKEVSKFVDKATFSLGNVPVVFGEFGTYFNYGGIDHSLATDYATSTQILDNYYRSFESLGLSRMQWCFSPENSYEDGEGWNSEDFSVVDPDLKPRSWEAYVRPYARATSGRLLSSRFYSPAHPYDLEKGIPVPRREFVLEMETKETDAPTEVFVPDIQYPQGFYVWVSDGVCYFDSERQILLWYPSGDSPGSKHSLRILPPRPEADVHGWDYFFSGKTVLDKAGGAQ
jgi:aryl-phospho-beta-D-glucosidase BglC (GH1 family)